MERKPAKLTKITQWLLKYKYAMLVLLVGIVLLLWPTGKSDKTKVTAVQEENNETTILSTMSELEQLELELAKTLSQVQGAGEVQVMLTLKTGTQYIYQTDLTQDEQEQDDHTQRSSTRSTVIVSAGSSQQQAVISQTIYPTYQGAVVISQGADNAAVKLDLVNAVSSLTGLSADKITVIKMKDH